MLSRAFALSPLALSSLVFVSCAHRTISSSGAAVRPEAGSASWVTTWGASQLRADEAEDQLHVAGQTLREIAHVSQGGARIRVHLSNAYGTTPLTIASVHVAVGDGGSRIRSGTDRAVLFGGSASVTIPAGGLFVSDPVPLDVAPLSDVALSLYVPDAASIATMHEVSRQTMYVSGKGDFTSAPELGDAATRDTWFVLERIDVEAASEASAIVVFGDSIVDGDKATPNANHRWPDFLAARLASLPASAPHAVVNAGIAGNRVLHDVLGPSMLWRFDRDVLGVAGVKYLVVSGGINDFGIPGAFHIPDQVVTAEEVIAGHKKLIERAHAHGLVVLGATLTPFEGVTFPGYATPEGEAKRQAVNAWIRTSGAYDVVLDFDRLLADPSHPPRLSPGFDSGDHIHPSDVGYKAMAAAVDLAVFGGRDAP